MNEEKLVFEKVEGGYSLMEYHCRGEELHCAKIPDTHEGEPVVEIGKNAFYYSGYMEEAIIPNTVRKMGEQCFESCIFLNRVTIPDSVVEIGKRAFLDCRCLSAIVFPKGVTEIPEECCISCTALESVSFQGEVTKIGAGAFASCTCLWDITFPQTLEIIEAKAFDSCHHLEKVHLPDTLHTLQDHCFSACGRLEEIHCREEVVCEALAFESSREIKQVPFSFLEYLEEEPRNQMVWEFFSKFENHTPQEQESLLEMVKERKDLQLLLFCKPSIETVRLLLAHDIFPTLRELAIYLEASIQQQCTEITAIFLDYREEHFSKEEREAYEERVKLTEMGFVTPTLEEFSQLWESVHTPEGTYIVGYKGGNKKERIPAQFGEGQEVIGLRFDKKYNFAPLEDIVIENGIQFIEDMSLAFHEQLKMVKLPDTLKKLVTNSFIGCDGLKEIQIPASVKYIENYAFSDCTSLEQVIFLGKGVQIDKEAFTGCTALEFVGEEKGENFKDKLTI